ncbi:MAG: transport ATPase [Moraxellaceae bacterium]|jgi:putative Mg2+ transporter-C (MgtC) family protein|nr:transport ATPase [Moraxellaceae bacterium]MDF3030303.1 transport ATPase [Moraxellaceae bacterium]
MNTHLDLLLRLGSAAFCGAVLGLNRGIKQKPAGLRTHALVALGAAYAAWMVITLSGRDPASISRIMQGAMTGVGFLGAGVIMRNEAEGRVEGLTTAASIWMATILGLGCGAGLYVDSALTMLVVLLVLLVSARMQERMVAMLRPGRHRRRGRNAAESVPERPPS